MRTDLHQHLLPEPLIGSLARRSVAPRVVGTGPTLRLELAGEPDSALQERDHDPAARAAEAEREGIDRIIVSLSTALGIEALPADEARPLVDAFNHGILELGGPFELWGAALTADDVDASSTSARAGSTFQPRRWWTGGRRPCSTASRRATRRSSSTPARRRAGPPRRAGGRP